MIKRNKKLICSECNETIIEVPLNVESVICSNCVQKRLINPDKKSSESLKKSVKENRKELLEKVLKEEARRFPKEKPSYEEDDADSK